MHSNEFCYRLICKSGYRKICLAPPPLTIDFQNLLFYINLGGRSLMTQSHGESIGLNFLKIRKLSAVNPYFIGMTRPGKVRTLWYEV